MSGRHQIWVYRCQNCGEKEDTMDSKPEMVERKTDCCQNPDYDLVDQYFR